MAEEFQTRFKHTLPKKISSSDVSFQYDVVPVQNAKDVQTPYVSGETLNFVMSRNSNEWVDMRSCRLEFDCTLYQETSETGLDPNLYKYYAFSAGPPFQTCCETVNESTIIYNYNNEFARFLAARAMCSSKSIICDTSITPTLNFTGDNNGISHLDKRNLSWNIDEYCRAGYEDLYSRIVKGSTVHSTGTGFTLRDRKYAFSVPLSMVSALASANDYVPVGYLSQNSNIGYRLALTIKSTQFNTTLQWVNPNINTNSLQIRIYNPRLLCRFVKIHNQTLVNELDRMFNKIPMEIGGIMITPTIKINFNNYISAQAKIVSTGNTGASLRYNISERSLKGMVMRFNNNTLNGYAQVDKNLTDVPIKLRSFQISVGSRTIPLQPLRFGNINDILKVQEAFYSDARHLFDPNNTYSKHGCITRWLDDNVVYPDMIGAGDTEYRTVNSYYINFENLTQNPLETEETHHSRGIDTWIEGNYISIDMEFSAALSTDLSVEVTFVKQSTLLVSNGQIELIENKIPIEPNAPIV